MEILDPGHKYLLHSLDIEEFEIPVILTFVKREGEGYPGNIGHHSGTTTQEVLRALIDRTKYVDKQIHHYNNDLVLGYLRNAILALELRAAERHNRTLPWFNVSNIENEPYCEKCGHIGCPGDCH